jgi:hypothetical protein
MTEISHNDTKLRYQKCTAFGASYAEHFKIDFFFGIHVYAFLAPFLTYVAKLFSHTNNTLIKIIKLVIWAKFTYARN